MARIVFIENPEQRGRCLASDLAAYIRSIPPRFDSITALVNSINTAPFERDDGDSALDASIEGACSPEQRSRIWPSSFNCWEATAHFAAEAARLLPPDWNIIIQDRTLNGRRHVWPIISFSNKLAPIAECQAQQPANAWYNDIFGGVHYVGDKVLRVFGLGSISDQISSLAGESLPDWARTEEQKVKKQHEENPVSTPAPIAPTPTAPPATTAQTSVSVQVQTTTSTQAKLSDSMNQPI